MTEARNIQEGKGGISGNALDFNKSRVRKTSALLSPTQPSDPQVDLKREFRRVCSGSGSFGQY